MATIKSFSDLEQSKKLAEILPLESVDMCYINGDSGKISIGEWGNNVHDEDDIPCWSLTALLSVFKDKKYFHRIYSDGVSYVLEIVNVSNPIIREVTNSNNPVDACVTMVEKLKELNLL